jgi:hypothetical protein
MQLSNSKTNHILRIARSLPERADHIDGGK